MKANGSRGFTLLELMIALGIIAIGLLAMARMQLSAIQGNALGGRMSRSIALGQNQMESFMTQDLETTGAPFDPAGTRWPDSGSTATVTGAVNDPTILGVQYNGYTVNWSVTANSPIDNVATLSVQVLRPGGAMPVTLTCVKRR